MTSDPRAFFALDLGAATASGALLGHVGGRWRLLGALSLPAGIAPEALCRTLATRLDAADPGLAVAIGVDPAEIERTPTVTVRSHPPLRMAVVAGSERGLAPLAAAATRTGFAVSAASAEGADPLEMTRLLLEPSVGAILAGAGDPPGADERGAMPEVAALVAAVAERRPELTVVLAGAMTDELARFGDPAGRHGEILLGAAAGTGTERHALDELLLDMAIPPDDSRRAAAVGVATLAEVLGRRVEYIEIGYNAGMRAFAWPPTGFDARTIESAVVTAAALVVPDAGDVHVDRVLGWSTVRTDRHRLRDRLRELRIAPWADAAGDGGLVRMAAARAAVARLVEATIDLPNAAPPDLIVAAGGAWAVAPGPAITLALTDVLRRSGASQFAHDHARLLAPLGSIVDPDERRTVVADLADDLLVPLGSVITPSGLRAGRNAGRLIVHASTGVTELDLVPGGLELVDLPPGQTAVAEFRFRDSVRLGTRGRHFAVEVAGGLGGLLIDLRDVPLRLPERHDRRRELLAAWQTSMWTGADA